MGFKQGDRVIATDTYSMGVKKGDKGVVVKDTNWLGKATIAWENGKTGEWPENRAAKI